MHDVGLAKKALCEILNDLENGVEKFSIVSDAIKYFDYAAGKGQNGKINYLGYYQFSQWFDRMEKKSITKDDGKKVIAVFTGTYSEFAGLPGYDDSSAFYNNFYDGVTFLQENIQRVNNSKNDHSLAPKLETFKWQ